MNKFTKPILPRMLKHYNFASFARQLNKYDFHNVRASLSPCALGIGMVYVGFGHSATQIYTPSDAYRYTRKYKAQSSQLNGNLSQPPLL